jgi:hypothetical protein
MAKLTAGRDCWAKVSGGAQRGVVLRSRGGLQPPRHLFRVQDLRDLARLTHEREVPCRLGSVERHGEEEAQHRNRAVDARRTHAGLGLMQLETAKGGPHDEG